MELFMSDCLFCKIVKREIPGSIVYEDDHVLAFNDINPQAPTHVLVVPKRHIASLNDLQPGDEVILGELVRRAATIAMKEPRAHPRPQCAFDVLPHAVANHDRL